MLSAGKGLDPMQTRAEVDATLPLLAPPQGRPYGYMDPSAWRAYAAWMAAHDLISQRTRHRARCSRTSCCPRRGYRGLIVAAAAGTRGPSSATRRPTSSTSWPLWLRLWS